MDTEFSNRHRTIRAGYIYPSTYEPTRLLDGMIAYWANGNSTLTTGGDAPGITAVYKHNPTIKNAMNFYDKKFNLYWPRPDEDYGWPITDKNSV
jgi:hypothetical protein